jgi:hypothetical protein
MSDFLKVVYRRAMEAADPATLQLAFDAAVLDRYAADGAYQVMRTDSAGRVRKQGGWSLDFGIAGEDRIVHASWGALMNQLPASEREHWSAHATVAAAMSDNFLRMQLSPMSCFDDGDLRPWKVDGA